MKYFICIAVLIIFLSSLNSSCKKETVIEKDTVIIVDIDTLIDIDTFHIRSIDTVIAMNARNMNLFSYKTLTLLDSGATTYFTTSEGVKFMGQDFRYGARLQTKVELGFNDRTIYYKWKGFGNGQLAVFVPQIKYDALFTDSTPPVMGVDLRLYPMNGTLPGTVAVTANTWYYTRVIPVAGTDNYRIVTSTGNYNNAGGTIIDDVTKPIYTKSGYLAFRMGDPWGGLSSYGILGELRIKKD